MLVGTGADVTKGVGPDTSTPICVAVQSGNREMVDYLLQQGVTDVRKALAVAREKNKDDIIGTYVYVPYILFNTMADLDSINIHVHMYSITQSCLFKLVNPFRAATEADCPGPERVCAEPERDGPAHRQACVASSSPRPETEPALEGGSVQRSPSLAELGSREGDPAPAEEQPGLRSRAQL